MAEVFDLSSDGLDALIQSEPIFVKPDNQIGQARRYLGSAILQDIEQRFAQRSCSRPDRDSLLDEEGSYLVDDRRPTGDQSGADEVISLQIKLILTLLPNGAQVRPQRGFGNSLSVVLIVLLPLHEGFDINRWDDARFVSKRS